MEADELTCVNAADDGNADEAAGDDVDGDDDADDDDGATDDAAGDPAEGDEAVDEPAAAGAVAVVEEAPHAANDNAVAVVRARTVDSWRRFDMQGSVRGRRDLDSGVGRQALAEGNSG